MLPNSLYQSEIAAAREAWDFVKVLQSYDKALKQNDFLIFEFIRFLADTGALVRIKEIFESKDLTYFQDLITHNHHDKRAGEILLKFYEKFKKALQEPQDLEEKLLFNAYHKNFDALKELLKSDEVLSDVGYMSMIVNYCFNELLAAQMLEESFFIRLIDCYIKSRRITPTRKQFVLSCGLEYFAKKSKFIDINAAMRLNSLIVNLASKELAKNFSVKIYQALLKAYPQLNALHLANQKNPIKTPKTRGKKVALLLCGQVRGNFNACFEVFNERIIKPLNADVFVFTWDSYFKYPGLAGSASRGNDWAYRYAKGIPCPSDLNSTGFFMDNFPLSYAKLNTKTPPQPTNKNLFKTLRNVKNIEIADEKEADKECKDFAMGQNQRESNMYKMVYGFKRILENVKEYEALNGEYDYLIRVRPDVVVYGEFSFEKLETLNANEIVDDFFHYGMQDQFFLGRREVMDRMLKFYDCVARAKDLRYYSKDVSANFSCHFAFWMHCILNDIFVVKSSYPRDLSVFLKDLKLPDIKEEFLIDFKNAPQSIKIRKDIKEFFAKAFGCGVKTNPKEHLSYKLGSALIKAHKAWYKGGYIKFFFELYKIRKEFKEKQKTKL
ncbi:hypothetical protein [Helicobacter turcicus]|uniref:Capsular biosynthesis protein n=1 Tax=Helicobacter turcicus TaxID=2867412 RepID=A0ABS7JP16_9HELI|nr:hypothetical protein [Helicobacter turcicus]MBX7491159.1 hypothetical protein [Helicobacter turcicus]MBX7546026.1 hypothetical protein [Helicobacter turcicus]